MHTCVSIQRHQQISCAAAFQWRCKSDEVCVCSLSLWPCICCLIFYAFDTLVRSGFFFPRCYVMINLPLGTWRPLAPQRIWRTLCAIPACFSSLPHTKRAFVFLSHFGRWARLCPSFCLSDSWLLFGREITTNLADQTQTSCCYFKANFTHFRYFLPFCFQLCAVGVNLIILQNSSCMCIPVPIHVSVCVQRERKWKHWSIFKTSGSISTHLFRDPEKLSSLPHIVT